MKEIFKNVIGKMAENYKIISDKMYVNNSKVLFTSLGGSQKPMI